MNTADCPLCEFESDDLNEYHNHLIFYHTPAEIAPYLWRLIRND